MASESDKMEEKDRLEIEKLKLEISTIHRQNSRRKITMISVLVGILVSSISIPIAVGDLKHRNRQLAMESQLRSHSLFLNTILDRMSGVKTQRFERDSAGGWIEKSREGFGTTVQQTAYVAVFSLAESFKELRPVAIKALEEQAVGASSPEADQLLRKLKELKD